MDIYDTARDLVALAKKKKALQGELNDIETLVNAAEKELYRSLAAQKLDEISSGGYVLKPVLKFTASAKDERTIRVLRRRGFGKLVKATVHPSTAHAFIREQAELNGGKTPGWIIDNFNIVNKETISMRRE